MAKDASQRMQSLKHGTEGGDKHKSRQRPPREDEATDEQIFKKAKMMEKRKVRDHERSMRQSLLEESTNGEDSKHVNLFRSEQLNQMHKSSAVVKQGEPSQAEKEAMTLGAIVGRNDM